MSASSLEDATKFEGPNKPVLALIEEPDTLSHSFLIRQSCALSYESASKLYTHVYLALEDYCCNYKKGCLRAKLIFLIKYYWHSTATSPTGLKITHVQALLL